MITKKYKIDEENDLFDEICEKRRQFSMFNRNVSRLQSDFIVLPTDVGDGYDNLRQEYNAIRRHHKAAAAGLIQKIYHSYHQQEDTGTGGAVF